MGVAVLPPLCDNQRPRSSSSARPPRRESSERSVAAAGGAGCVPPPLHLAPIRTRTRADSESGGPQSERQPHVQPLPQIGGGGSRRSLGGGSGEGAAAAAAAGARRQPAALPYHQRLRDLLDADAPEPSAGQDSKRQPQRSEQKQHRVVGRPSAAAQEDHQTAKSGASALPLVQGRQAVCHPAPVGPRDSGPPEDVHPHLSTDEQWEWFLRTPPVPESPYGSDILRALLSSISPKFAVKRPEGYVPITPSSISSSRYARSDIWAMSCPGSPGWFGAGAAAAAASPSAHGQCRTPGSPEPLHKRLLMRAALAAGLGTPSPGGPGRALHRSPSCLHGSPSKTPDARALARSASMPGAVISPGPVQDTAGESAGPGHRAVPPQRTPSHEMPAAGKSRFYAQHAAGDGAHHDAGDGACRGNPRAPKADSARLHTAAARGGSEALKQANSPSTGSAGCARRTRPLTADLMWEPPPLKPSLASALLARHPHSGGSTPSCPGSPTLPEQRHAAGATSQRALSKARTSSTRHNAVRDAAEAAVLPRSPRSPAAAAAHCTGAERPRSARVQKHEPQALHDSGRPGATARSAASRAGSSRPSSAADEPTLHEFALLGLPSPDRAGTAGSRGRRTSTFSFRMGGPAAAASTAGRLPSARSEVGTPGLGRSRPRRRWAVPPEDANEAEAGAGPAVPSARAGHAPQAGAAARATLARRRTTESLAASSDCGGAPPSGHSASALTSSDDSWRTMCVAEESHSTASGAAAPSTDADRLSPLYVDEGLRGACGPSMADASPAAARRRGGTLRQDGVEGLAGGDVASVRRNLMASFGHHSPADPDAAADERQAQHAPRALSAGLPQRRRWKQGEEEAWEHGRARREGQERVHWAERTDASHARGSSVRRAGGCGASSGADAVARATSAGPLQPQPPSVPRDGPAPRRSTSHRATEACSGSARRRTIDGCGVAAGGGGAAAAAAPWFITGEGRPSSAAHASATAESNSSVGKGSSRSEDVYKRSRERALALHKVLATAGAAIAAGGAAAAVGGDRSILARALCPRG